MVLHLLEHGAEPRIRDEDGITAGHELLLRYKSLAGQPAGPAGVVKALDLMIDGGLRPNHTFGDGISLLRLCITGGAPEEILDLLHRRGAHLSIREKAGLEPIHVAAMTGNIDAVAFLLGAGVDPDDHDEDGLTALHHSKDAPITDLLISRGATVDAQDHQGRSPLAFHLQTMKKDTPVDVVARLLEAGARLDLPDFVGKTPSAIIDTRRLKQVRSVLGALAARTSMSRAIENAGISRLAPK